jgi:hypothetical protein
MSVKKQPGNKSVKLTGSKALVRHTHNNYPLEEKVRAMVWVHEHPGRDAIHKAAEKFKIAYSTLHSWIKNEPIIITIKKKNRVKPQKKGRPKGSIKNDAKASIEKIQSEAQAKQIHLHELMKKLGWPEV